ncbi:hypothetical protein C808_04981 [Lachnospiraceae bacterium M18-1]|nr:hypothetical protein C808_04981 [Lachnospiraceae bacterium M18-1]
MTDKVIVTMIYSDREFDMELPANTKIEQIKPAIAAALRCKGIHLPETFQLAGSRRLLEESATLLENGIWDGSYLKII